MKRKYCYLIFSKKTYHFTSFHFMNIMNENEMKLKEENKFTQELFDFKGDETQLQHLKDFFVNFIMTIILIVGQINHTFPKNSLNVFINSTIKNNITYKYY